MNRATQRDDSAKKAQAPPTIMQAGMLAPESEEEKYDIVWGDDFVPPPLRIDDEEECSEDTGNASAIEATSEILVEAEGYRILFVNKPPNNGGKDEHKKENR